MTDMRKKAFTLVEILVALIIVAVLVSLSIVTFQKTIEANNDKICRQNLKVLQSAIEIYTVENNALPATLSLLTSEQIHLAYEKVAGKPKENRLAGYFNNLIGIKPLFADLGKYYGNDPKILRCPADKTTATGDSSYSYNTAMFKSTGDLKNYPNTVLLSDKDFYHKKGISSGDTYQIGISPNGKYGTKDQDGTIKGDISFTSGAIIAAVDCAIYDEAECGHHSSECEWESDDHKCETKDS